MAGWIYPRVLAHRGGGRLAPENTIAALACGLAHGYRGVEFDATLAADAVPVLMHDATLDRTTGRHGAVAQLRADELACLDAGAWHSARYAGEPVPTLAAALAWCGAHGVWANVEIKPGPGADEATGAIVATGVAQSVRDLGAVAPAPLLSSFSPAALRAARAAAPALARGLLVDAVPADWRAQIEALECVALHCNHRRLDARLAAEVKRAGCALFCYTVNEPARAGLLRAWGVDAFCTDRIDLIAPDPA